MILRNRRNLFTTFFALVVLFVIAFSVEPVRDSFWFLWGKLRGGYTVAERVQQVGPAVEARLRRSVEAAGLTYPPREVAYVAFKDSRRLEVYGRIASEAPWRFIKAYPVLGLSGKAGPKLVEGDYQVPEGIYRAEFLHANSRFHLAIRLDYPNEFDKRMAIAEGRNSLGGDIMIHGSSASIGCLAMGNRSIEDLFVLAALVSKERVRVLIAPTDFRVAAAILPVAERLWINALYADLQAELQQFSNGT
jgi:murein L,D-transpeptidase YafK